MLGQLQDAGNTTTLAHYLELLRGAGMVAGLEKFSGAMLRIRASSPKLVALNTALMTAPSGRPFADAQRDGDFWGRLVETAVGAHLVNGQVETRYWRDRNREVDYVAGPSRSLTAIEVKSGIRKASLPGMTALADRYEVRRQLLIGEQGLPVEDFLMAPVDRWLSS